MLIVGAKGFAKEVLEVLHQQNQIEKLAFYDDVNQDTPDKLFENFAVLKSVEAAKNYFATNDNRFTIGIGNPVLRKTLNDKFTAIGGIFTSTISKSASLGSYDVNVGQGTNILSEVILSKSTIIE